MMLDHIGYAKEGNLLHDAIEMHGQYAKKLVMTGRNNGATGLAYGEYSMQNVEDPDLEEQRDRNDKAS